MKTIILNMAMVLAFLLVSCSADTPTQVASSNGDVLAKLVAGAVGFESNGLAATINDLAVAGTGGTVRSSMMSAANTAVVVTRNDSIFDPQTRIQLLSLACERNRADTYSEWDLSYKIRFASTAGRGSSAVPAGAENAETHTSGTFRSASLKVQGESDGRIGFDKVEPGREVTLSGTYRWDGTAVVPGSGEERYDDVTITFNWNRLNALAGAAGAGQILNGRCDVNIKANGPDGVISSSGTLAFAGNDNAVLTIGGKSYVISIGGADVVRKA
jgi:hypothetical protein